MDRRREARCSLYQISALPCFSRTSTRLTRILLGGACRKRDLRIRCCLWPGYSVIGIRESVTTGDQIDWCIVLVHDRLHENHARMRSVQHLLQIAAALNDVSICLLLTREDIWQFRIPPVCNVVVLGVLTQNGSLYRVYRVV